MDQQAKNFVRPSIPGNKTPTITETAISPTPVIEKDYIWYLKNVCGGQDKYEFEDHKEAYKFGWDLRERHGDKIKVQTSEKTVRVFPVCEAPKNPTPLSH